jgi:DNA-directed RNA polymerase subunit N (RpoN/RPB10)
MVYICAKCLSRTNRVGCEYVNKGEDDNAFELMGISFFCCRRVLYNRIDIGCNDCTVSDLFYWAL